MSKPLFSIFLFFLTIEIILSCNVNSITYQLIKGPRIPSNIPQFNISDIKAHLDEEGLSIYSSNIKTTISCVDGRKDDPILGSPGGDMGEFLLGLETYFVQKPELIPTPEIVYKILHRYISEVASPSRKFYCHTAKHYVDLLLESLEIYPKPIIFPESEPAHADLWYEAFVDPPHQGCGHLRFMLKNQTNFGVNTPRLPQMVLEAYLKIWWSGDEKMTSRMTFDILQGGIDSGAIAAVTNDGPGCPDHSPLVSPNELGSSVFVYHPHVVNDFRHQIVIPFFKRYDKSINSDKFWKDLNALAALQLEAILSMLTPANLVNTFTVKVFTEGDPEAKIENYRLVTLVVTVLIILFLGILSSVLSGYLSFKLGKKYERDHNFYLFLLDVKKNQPQEEEKKMPVLQSVSESIGRTHDEDEHIHVNFSSTDN